MRPILRVLVALRLNLINHVDTNRGAALSETQLLSPHLRGKLDETFEPLLIKGHIDFYYVTGCAVFWCKLDESG